MESYAKWLPYEIWESIFVFLSSDFYKGDYDIMFSFRLLAKIHDDFFYEERCKYLKMIDQIYLVLHHFFQQFASKCFYCNKMYDYTINHINQVFLTFTCPEILKNKLIGNKIYSNPLSIPCCLKCYKRNLCISYDEMYDYYDDPKFDTFDDDWMDKSHILSINSDLFIYIIFEKKFCIYKVSNGINSIQLNISKKKYSRLTKNLISQIINKKNFNGVVSFIRVNLNVADQKVYPEPYIWK